MSKFVIYRDKSEGTDQCWRWRLVDDNGARIAKSEEAFLKENVKPSIKLVQGNVNPKTLICLNGSDDEDGAVYRFAYHQSDKDEQWYWKLQAGGNNELMAVGGEGFSSKSKVSRSIENVRLEICRAGITFENIEDDPAYEAKEANREDKTNVRKGAPGS